MKLHGDSLIEKLLLLIIFGIFAPFSAHADVTCNKFDIETKLQGSTLEISVDTDLPENTVVFVRVFRTYIAKGHSNALDYAGISLENGVGYFDEKSTVGKWKAKHKISIDNKKWKADLKAKQEKLDKIGLGSEVESISKNLTASMIVPINQPNPAFGKRNSKLNGKAVITSGTLRNVHGEAEIEYPLDESDIEKNLPSLNPLTLSVGRTYIVSNRIPLMTTHSPSASHTEIMKTKKIYKGGMIRILESTTNAEGNIWYRVDARNRENQTIGKGWVNSIALMRQDLKLH